MAYQGWKNYETWAVALWLDNDERSQDYLLGRVRELREEAPGREETYWTPAEYVKFRLADELKQDHEDAAEALFEGQAVSVLQDLLGAAISEVDWREVAEHYMEI